MAETQTPPELSERELDEILGKIIVELSESTVLPREALQLAVKHWEAVLPVMLEALEEDLADPAGIEEDADLLFFFFHLCGQMRETRAYRPLMRLAGLPPVEREHPILGDAVTATLHQVAISIFDGDPTPIQQVILDENAYEFVRSALLEALACLTTQGRTPRDEMKSFLLRCDAELQPRDENYVWVGWQSAISFAGLSELREIVKSAFDDGRIPPEFMDYDEFEEDLKAVIEGVGEHASARELRHFGDVIDELSHWHGFTPEGVAERERAERVRAEGEDEADDERDDWPLLSEPYVNPLRNIGRNDPCPCGSGKKFKKCCLR
jgi:uncharacterized protein